jgi:hypothetical protein
MYKKKLCKTTYNSCRNGSDASQTGISPVIVLFCNHLHMWFKANLIIMHELNEFSTFNEMAKLEQNQGDWLPIFRRWLHYKQVFFCIN